MSFGPGSEAALEAKVRVRRRRHTEARARTTTTDGLHTTPGRRWIIYIRQSEKKRNQSGEVTTTSIEIQERACRAAIAQMDPSPASVTIIIDHGRRGGRGRLRPGRDEMLALIEQRAADAVMAFKTARIGRDIEESEHLWNRCLENGAFIAAVDCRNLSSPVHRGVLFGMAQQESIDRRDYAQANVDRRRDLGLPPMKTGVAYGLRWDADRVAPEPEEFRVVTQIFSWFDRGVSMNEIARRLTRRGAPRRHARHGQWDAAAVSRILRCPWYIGLIPDGETFFSTGQSFIDIELWERAHARLDTIADTGQRLNHVLSGVLFCGECGGWSPMSLCYSRKTRQDGTVTVRHRYRCVHRVRDNTSCAGQSIDAQQVEQFLLAQLQHVISGDGIAKARLKRRQIGRAEELSDVASTHDTEIQRLRSAQRELFARRQSGEVIPDFLYNEEMTRLETEARHHERSRVRALAGAKLSAAALKRLRAELADGPLGEQAWSSFGAAARNEFLRLVFPFGITVTKTGISGRRPPDVSERLAPRTADEANAAADRRNGTAVAPTA